MKRIRFVLSVMLLFGGFHLVAQNLYQLQGVALKKIDKIDKDSSFIIKDIKAIIQKNNNSKFRVVGICEYQNQELKIPIDELKKNVALEANNNNDLVLYTLLKGEVVDNLIKYGPQLDLRNDIKAEVLEYLFYLNNDNGILNEPFLENYLYSLIYKIIPNPFIPFRNGQINVTIEKNSLLNACIYSNGTLKITTGMLASLHSEDELVAILAHEVGHFILDHSVVNINKQVSRQKRAAVWGMIATGLTAAAEVAGSVIAEKNNRYYVPGLATSGASFLSTVISEGIVDHLGMEYNIRQDEEADEFALRALGILGYDQNALAVAFSRISGLEIKDGNYSPYFSGYTDLELKIRFIKAGEVVDLQSDNYRKIMSIANTVNAQYDFANKHFYSAYQASQANILNDIASVDDLIMNATCLQMLVNNDESNRTTIDLLSKARMMNPDNFDAHKYLVIAYMRQKSYDNALTALDEYVRLLNEELMSHKKVDISPLFITEEVKWCTDMRRKMTVLTD